LVEEPIPVAAAELAHRVDSEAGLVNPQASRAPLARPNTTRLMPETLPKRCEVEPMASGFERQRP